MKLFIFKFSTSTFYIHSHLENVSNEIQWIFSHVFCNIWSLSNSLTFKTYRVNIKIFLRWIVKTSGVYISRKINSAFDFIIFISYHEVNLPMLHTNIHSISTYSRARGNHVAIDDDWNACYLKWQGFRHPSLYNKCQHHFQEKKIMCIFSLQHITQGQFISHKFFGGNQTMYNQNASIRVLGRAIQRQDLRQLACIDALKKLKNGIRRLKNEFLPLFALLANLLQLSTALFKSENPFNFNW